MRIESFDNVASVVVKSTRVYVYTLLSFLCTDSRLEGMGGGDLNSQLRVLKWYATILSFEKTFSFNSLTFACPAPILKFNDMDGSAFPLCNLTR